MWFFLSIAAGVLPLLGAYINSRRPLRNPWLFSVASFLCFAAMCMDELFTIHRRTFSGDFGGIEDTIGAVLLITGAVAAAVVVLNAIVLGIWYGKDK